MRKRWTQCVNRCNKAWCSYTTEYKWSSKIYKRIKKIIINSNCTHVHTHDTIMLIRGWSVKLNKKLKVEDLKKITSEHKPDDGCEDENKMKELYLEIEIKVTKIYLFLDLFHFGDIFHQLNTSTVCQWRSLGFTTAWWCTIAFTRLQRSQYSEWIYVVFMWWFVTSKHINIKVARLHHRSLKIIIKRIESHSLLIAISQIKKNYNHRVKLVLVEL